MFFSSDLRFVQRKNRPRGTQIPLLLSSEFRSFFLSISSHLDVYLLCTSWSFWFRLSSLEPSMLFAPNRNMLLRLVPNSAKHSLFACLCALSTWQARSRSRRTTSLPEARRGLYEIPVSAINPGCGVYPRQFIFCKKDTLGPYFHPVPSSCYIAEHQLPAPPKPK